MAVVNKLEGCSEM